MACISNSWKSHREFQKQPPTRLRQTLPQVQADPAPDPARTWGRPCPRSEQTLPQTLPGPGADPAPGQGRPCPRPCPDLGQTLPQVRADPAPHLLPRQTLPQVRADPAPDLPGPGADPPSHLLQILPASLHG